MLVIDEESFRSSPTMHDENRIQRRERIHPLSELLSSRFLPGVFLSVVDNTRAEPFCHISFVSDRYRT